MAMDQDERNELIDTYKLMSAEELRGMKGDDAETDALIDEVLGAGKAVEVKDPAADGAPENQPAKPEATNEDEDEDEEDDSETDPPADPAKDAAAQAQADAAAAAQADADAQAAAAEAAKVEVPKLDLSHMDAHFADRLKALDAGNAQALKQMMEGEIDADAYATKNAEYLAARDALRDEKAATAGWLATTHNFMAKASTDGVDYFNNAEHNAALDDWVKRLASKGVPDDQVLEQAHKKVLAEFDIAPKAAAQAAPAAPAKPAKPVPRAPDLSQIPPTLGKMPAAASADDTGGAEFAHLDGLTGMALEQAIARMSPDQRARYEAE